MITGLFMDKDGAECAYRAAVARGHDESDINVLMSDDTRRRLFPDNRPTDGGIGGQAAEVTEKPAKGSKLGGPIGGTVGTIAPVVAAVGTLVLIPGIVIAGPVAVALTAAGAVGLAGGLIGALTDWGIPKDSIHKYEGAIRGGGIVLGVKPSSDEDTATIEREWRAVGGQVTVGR